MNQRSYSIHIIGIAILAILVVLLPFHLRYAHNNPTLPGTEPYYHARIAKDLGSYIHTATDPAIVGGRLYYFEPYHLVLYLAYAALGDRAFTFFPALLAIASVLGFYLLLKRFEIPRESQTWMLLAYVLSPPLITAGFVGTKAAFILVLLLFGAYALLGSWWPVGVILFITAGLSGLGALLAAIAVLLFIAFMRKDIQRVTIVLVLLAVIFIIGIYPPAVPLDRGVIDYVSDFGGVNGLSIFAILLSLVGALILYEHKRHYYGVFALILVFVCASVFFPDLLLFVNLAVSALAGTALARLSKHKWKLQFIRLSSLLVLFCGLLFSGISHTVSLSELPPNPEFFKALDISPGVVFSHENYGFWIEYMGHRAVVDQLSLTLPDANERMWDERTIFASTDLEKTRTLLSKYNVTYVLITNQMKEGLVWDRDQEGLAFMVQNNETFKTLSNGKSTMLLRFNERTK